MKTTELLKLIPKCVIYARQCVVRLFGGVDGCDSDEVDAIVNRAFDNSNMQRAIRKLGAFMIALDVWGDTERLRYMLFTPDGHASGMCDSVEEIAAWYDTLRANNKLLHGANLLQTEPPEPEEVTQDKCSIEVAADSNADKPFFSRLKATFAASKNMYAYVTKTLCCKEKLNRSGKGYFPDFLMHLHEDSLVQELQATADYDVVYCKVDRESRPGEEWFFAVDRECQVHAGTLDAIQSWAGDRKTFLLLGGDMGVPTNGASAWPTMGGAPAAA